MARKFSFSRVIGFSLLLSSTFAPETDKLGIRSSRSTVLVFNDEIQSAHIDANSKKEVDYYNKIEGNALIIRAKKLDAQPTTLTVQYGKTKPYTIYGADLFPDDTAPLQWNIRPTGSTQVALKANGSGEGKGGDQISVFEPREKQQYNWFAVEEGGITVMVTNIAHSGKETFIRVYIDNRTTVNLKLNHCSFEYVTKLRKWLFFTSQQRNKVKPLLLPKSLEVAPQTFEYFDFSIPTYTSDWLELIFGETENGSRKYEIELPAKILLQAPRK